LKFNKVRLLHLLNASHLNSYSKSCAVTLWLPQLFSKARIEEALKSEQTEKTDAPSFSQLRLPALQRLLSKGQALPLPHKLNPPAAFYRTASYLAHQKTFLPIAATMAAAELADFKAHSNHFWIKVDPVNFVPDRDTLLMMPPSQLRVTEAESLALVAAFNQHFATEGLRLFYGGPQSWYLSLPQSVDLQTTPLEDAIMQPLLAHSPQGHAASYWLKLMNETQMLFYSHPVNEVRRQQGLPEINGVWIWGEGQLDFDQLQPQPDLKIFAQSAYLKGLAKLSQAELMENWPEKCQNPQPRSQIIAENAGKHLFFVKENLIEDLPNFTQAAWLKLLEELEQEWWQPLLQALKEERIHSLLLLLGNGKQYHIQPKDLKKFWRFKRSLAKLL